MATAPKITIGNYRIIKEVGAGGLGRVFKAIDEQTGKTVAVKILHDRFKSNPKRLGFFHRELLIAARLKHKNIVECIDANFEPPDCYIVSEFVDGWSLHHLLKTIGRFPPLVALSIGIDILQGIDYLHLHDTIHSDLSSPNVMIDKNGRVLVTDFGLACEDEVEDYKKYVIGTPGYYSPEHVSQTAIAPASDLYCVGLLIYEMIAGCKAVPPSRQRKEIVAAMDKVSFEPIVCADRKLQRLVRRFLKKALRTNPRRRYVAAEKMVYEIYSILKRYQIDYARLAIMQFLHQRQLTSPVPDNKLQNIYYGFAPPPS